MFNMGNKFDSSSLQLFENSSNKGCLDRRERGGVEFWSHLIELKVSHGKWRSLDLRSRVRLGHILAKCNSLRNAIVGLGLPTPKCSNA